MKIFSRFVLPGQIHKTTKPLSALTICLALLVIAAIPQVANAVTYSVCDVGCDFASPEAAVNSVTVVNGDQISVTPATYTLGATMVVDKSITLLGNGSVFDANGLRAIEISGPVNFSLTGVTIRNGQAPAASGGGGLKISLGAIATLVNVSFENNQAEFGGAVHNEGANITLRAVSFLGNEATSGSGGAVLTDLGGLTTLENATVDGNLASDSGGALAILNGGTVDVVESTISNNAALSPVQTASNLDISGTTVSCGPEPLGQTFTADASVLSSFEFQVRLNGGANPIPNDLNVTGLVREGGPGGPIIATGTAFIPGSTWPGSSSQTLSFVLDQPVALIPGNTYAIESAIVAAYSVYISAADTYAGGQRYTCDDLLLPNDDHYFRTFGGTAGNGSGIYAESAFGPPAAFNVTNSTVSSNVGDGVYASALNGLINIHFSTITNNSGNGITAATGVFGNPGSLINIDGTIIAGNGGDDCASTGLLSAIDSFDYNLIGDITGCDNFTPIANDLAGSALSPIDPLLGPLQYNGGLTPTHAIDETSPAFDAGGTDQAGLPCENITTDQRKFARPRSSACDIGAFEFVGPLQTRINNASPGDTIILADGVYNESITIGDGIKLQGSGPDNVVIDVTGQNSPAITATGNFALEGIRVTGGNSASNGGGIDASLPATNIQLDNVVFDNNHADADGGAIYLSDGSNIVINSSTFRQNNATGEGGAIFSSGLIDSNTNVFESNAAEFGGAIVIAGNIANSLSSSQDTFLTNTAGTSGGAILNSASTIDINLGVFQGNAAGDELLGIAGRGGAIYTDSSADIASSVFSTNGVENNFLEGGTEPGQGGAIFNNGQLQLVNTTVESSYAGQGGGLYNGADGSSAIGGSTFFSNVANGSGTVGAAIGGAGSISLSNSTLSGNTNANGGNGAGIGLLGGSATLNNVTVAYNSSQTGQGPGLFAEAPAFIRLSNSLVSDNTGGLTDCLTLQSLGYNLFDSTQCTFTSSDIVAPTQIDLLDANGGLTLTHALFGASPAIDAGHPVPSFPQFDAANLPLLQLGGSTRLDAGNLLLADPTTTVGSAFVRNPINPGQDFSAVFEFRIVANPATGGASDGITFTISDDPSALGQGGGLLGIANYFGVEGAIGVISGVSVEFDTWLNGAAEGANDPGPDHIGINLNGNLSSQVIHSYASQGILSDGSVWTAWIDYFATNNTLEVRASNDGLRPALPTLSTTVDIAALTGPVAYVGFTGATAASTFSGEQRIVSFSFNNSCEVTDQRGDIRPKGSSCDIGAYEGAVIPLAIGAATLNTDNAGQDLANGSSYPGVVDIRIIDIPIEKLTGDSFNAPESAPLGSFPLGSFPIGSFDLRASPMGSFPLGSFPIGSFPIGSFPLGSFPLSSIPLLSEGGWKEVLRDIPELKGAPLQNVTLEQLLRINPPALAEIELRDLAIEGSPLASLSLPGMSLGDTRVSELNQWTENANLASADGVCQTLNDADPSFTDCTADDTLLGLEIKGAPVAALSLSSLPLGSFPIGSFPLGSFPIGSFPMGSFPLGSFPLGSFPMGSFPMGSFPMGSFPIGSFPMGSFDLLAAPTASLPLGSFPIGSFPLGSFEIDGKTFCEFYDEKALVSGDKTCNQLGVDPGTDSLASLVIKLQEEADAAGDTSSGIASTPLGSFPMGSFPIGSFPIGSFPLGSFDLTAPPLSELTLGHFGGCQIIDGTDDCSGSSLSPGSSLLDVESEYGTLAASPLGSFPIGSFGIADLPMGSFPMGSFEINGTPLGSFPLGSFDLLTSPLGSFPLGSFPLGSFDAIIEDPDGICSRCETLAEAELAGVISAAATLADLSGVPDFDITTLGTILDSMTLAMIHGSGTLADIRDPGALTLGQMLVAMMLKSDFPWETIPLEQLDPQNFSADNFVDYIVNVPLTGNGSDVFTISVTLDKGFMYRQGSTILEVTNQLGAVATAVLEDPVISNNGDSTQTLVFNVTLSGNTDNSLAFSTVAALSLGNYPAKATVQLGADVPVDVDSSNAGISIIPDPDNDISDPELATTAPLDVLSLGYINTPDDNDYFRIAPPAAGDRVAVFMSNPAGDNDLIMYEPLSTVEVKGQLATAAALDSIPFEDDGVDYEGNQSEEPNALEDVNLADAPLASISTNRGTQDESVSAIAGNTEPFTLQVSGYNGASSPKPYTLRVKITPQVPSPQCTARNWPGSQTASVAPAGTWTPNTNAVFLVNGSRLASSDPDGAVGADAALAAINSLVNAPGINDGVVVDVSSIYGVDYGAWDANPCDVDAPNAIVNAITRYLEEQRAGSPRLTYVTIVGSDEVIPFARKADETSIANESTFAGEFSDNAMYGALITRHFLSDDTYGDLDPIPWLDRYLNVPELGVGRLVEYAVDIQTAADNYLASSGVLDPQTALSAGYDFVSDAAEDINNTFNSYGPELGYSVKTALIDPPGITPKTAAWTGEQFLEAAGIGSANPVDLVSFNMHFDFDEALPSIGDALSNYETSLLNVSDLAGADLTGGIWFTVGCHSGTNVPDVSVVGGAPSEDWAQGFNRLGALYLAQNAYGLGDTEAIALTERLMANFARNLDGNLTIGQAHAYAKQQYFADLGLYGEYDYKALQAATLFGLPMYKYGLGTPVAKPLPPLLPVATDPLSGLSSASWSLTDTGITETPNTSKGDLFSVDGEVQFVHFRPLQPIVRRDVTGLPGEVASGAFLTALTTEDKAVSDIAFARPVIDEGGNEPEIESDEVVFPTSFTNIASFKAPPPGGGPMAPRQQLNVIVGQFTSPLDGGSSGTERLFRGFDAQVFYRPTPVSSGAFASLAATVLPVEDFTRPEFDNVQATVVGSGNSQQASFSVDVTDNGAVLRVAVLYLQSVTGTPEKGNWVLVDLVPNPGTNTWTGGGPVDLSGIANGQIDYMVQAVDSNGNVANSTFKGLFYVAEELPPPPDPGTPGNIGVLVKVGGENVIPGSWITTDPVDIEVTDQDPEITYVYSVDFAPFQPLTSSGFQITEDGVHTVTVQQSDGSNPVTFVVLIDTTPPRALISTPANGQFIVQGQEPVAAFDCLDAGSGISTCTGTVANGIAVPSSLIGANTFSVTAQDDAGLGPTTAEHNYFVVKPLEVSGPTGPIVIGETVTITASATDLAEFAESVTVDWGDGSATETLTLDGAGVSAINAQHVFESADAFDITVTVNYEGRFQQSGVIGFVTVFDGNSQVSGAGSIQSPAGAFTPQNTGDAEVDGEMDFNFALKYKYQKAKTKKGKAIEAGWTLEGNSKFRFHEGGLNLEAVSYDWLIVNEGKARFRGTAEGKKHDDTVYRFEVTILDANIAESGVSEDHFGIKVWTENSGGSVNVLYDSMLGDGNAATTPIKRGSIQIHEQKGRK